MLKITHTENEARRGIFHTSHGTIQTPFFMNVATSAAIKGAISTEDLERVNCQVMLCNAYHTHLRPGDEVIKVAGGLQGFTNWSKPTLTDSGGFQVFSLAKLRKITENGVAFNSHIDGKRLFIGAEESMTIQSNLGSTIAMAFDECAPAMSSYEYAKEAMERTTRWLVRSKNKLAELKEQPDTINKEQLLFAINQGCTFEDLRVQHMQEIVSLELDGYAIGGLAVGEPPEVMYKIIETVRPYMPSSKPRYLMGVGTPVNIIEAVLRGIDMFDCVMPSRNARHATVFTSLGVMQLRNEKYKLDFSPIEENCKCPTCQRYTRGYIRHLFMAKEQLAGRLCVLHNLYFYNNLMETIRLHIENGTFTAYARENIKLLGRRV
jgi:queuine tRNA-ribosyltransferase